MSPTPALRHRPPSLGLQVSLVGAKGVVGAQAICPFCVFRHYVLASLARLNIVYTVTYSVSLAALTRLPVSECSAG